MYLGGIGSGGVGGTGKLTGNGTANTNGANGGYGVGGTGGYIQQVNSSSFAGDAYGAGGMAYDGGIGGTGTGLGGDFSGFIGMAGSGKGGAGGNLEVGPVPPPYFAYMPQVPQGLSGPPIGIPIPGTPLNQGPSSSQNQGTVAPSNQTQTVQQTNGTNSPQNTPQTKGSQSAAPIGLPPLRGSIPVPPKPVRGRHHKAHRKL